MNRGLLGLVVMLAGAGASTSEPADRNWPQWRGPGGQGTSAEPNLPEEWSATKNVVWKTAIPGRGHSSPVVWGDHVFLTTAIEGDVVPGARAPKHIDETGSEFRHPDAMGDDRRVTLKVLALEAATGRVRWERTAYEGLPLDSRHKKASFASPTPATDGRLVFAFFASEGLYAYDFEGTLVWKARLGPLVQMGVGAGTSPVLYQDLVIVQCDEDAGEKSFVAALDKKTGKEVWRVPRRVQASWATPVLVETTARTELVTSGTEAIIAYDPATGRELWRSQGLASNAVPSPVVTQDIVILSAGYPDKMTFAIRAGGSGDVTDTPRVLWRYRKGSAYVPSPILYGDYLYLMTDKGLVTCLDARTGAVQYEGGRPPVAATFMASPIAFGGKIVLFSEDGDAFFVKAGPRHEIVRTNSLAEPIYASAAAAGGRLFIRGETHLYCIGDAAS